MKFKYIFIVGAGGIGSHLMEPLVRMMAYHKSGTNNILLIDGDIYEEKNQTRQLFDNEFVGVNKAEALAKKISTAVAPIEHHGEYINKNKFIEVLASRVSMDDPILVITAVDNHASRKAVIEALDEGEYANFVFISGGNGYSNGQVLVYAKIQGELGTVHPFNKYDDLKFPADHIPGDPGCQDEAPSTPQLITANASAALGILWTVQAMLDKSHWYEELHFDCKKMKLVYQGEKIWLPEETNKGQTNTDENSEGEQPLESEAILV